MKAGSKYIVEVITEMVETQRKKNEDYTGDGHAYANFELAALIGGVPPDIIFRALIGTKVARLTALWTSGNKVNNEPLEDTLLDLAVYTILQRAYTRWNDAGRPMEEWDYPEKSVGEPSDGRS